MPLKPVEDTRVELCALIPDDECLITQLLVFQALLVFPSSVAEDQILDMLEWSLRAASACGGF